MSGMDTGPHKGDKGSAESPEAIADNHTTKLLLASQHSHKTDIHADDIQNKVPAEFPGLQVVYSEPSYDGHGCTKADYRNNTFTNVDFKDEQGNIIKTFHRNNDGTWNEDGKLNEHIKQLTYDVQTGKVTISHSDDHSTFTKLADGREETKWPGGHFKLRNQWPHRDGYQPGFDSYEHRPDGHGGYTDIHNGSRPDDNFKVLKTSDGRIQVFDHYSDKHSGKPYEQIANADVNKQRMNLEQLAEKHITNPADLSRFQADMARLENRSRDLEAKYELQGLSPKDAENKAHQEVVDTYTQISRLFLRAEHSPLSDADRTQVAEQVMRNAANPSLIDQGHFDTCNVAAIEVRAFSTDPARAAKLLADVANTGQYEFVSKDLGLFEHKHTVKLNQEAFQNQEQDHSNPPLTNNRSLASQLFQVTAINVYYAVNNPNLRYEQHKPSANNSSGELLVDVRTGKPYLEDGQEIHSPNLSAHQIVKLSEDLLGHKARLLGNFADGWFDPEHLPNQINNEGDLVNKLKEAQDRGEMPILLKVHTGNEPFNTDGNDAGGYGGWHCVCVSKFSEGPPPQADLDNTWGPECDHKGLLVSTLFHSLKAPDR